MVDVAFIDAGQRLVVEPKGRMDASDGDLMASEILGRLADTATGVTINLDGLDFINFGAVRALLRLARDLKDRRCQLAFTGGGEGVRYTLDQAGLDDFFPFTPPYVSNRGKVHEIQ